MFIIRQIYFTTDSPDSISPSIAVPGLIGCCQALEVIKLTTGMGSILASALVRDTTQVLECLHEVVCVVREIHPLDPQPHRHSMLVPTVCAPRVMRCSLGKYWSRDWFRGNFSLTQGL